MQDDLPSPFEPIRKVFEKALLPRIRKYADAEFDATYFRCNRCGTVQQESGTNPPPGCYSDKSGRGGCGRPSSEIKWTRLSRGATPERYVEAIRKVADEDGLDPSHLEGLAREIGLFSGQEYGAALSGPDLFRDVIDVVRRHYFLAFPWQYIVVALFILQAWVADRLPVVFYLPVAGPKGTGKTNFLSLIASLTNALQFENVSIAAMARTMQFGRTVTMDELDTDRGKEANEIRDSLLRSGYKRNAPKYTRWDAAKKSPDEIAIFGPRAFGYRGVLDDALQDRGFPIPAVKPVGQGGYEYVLRNFWPDTGDLAKQLESWGKEVRNAFPPDIIQGIAESDAFQDKVREVVAELGANRDSELATIALLVAEMAGVDVLEELRDAGNLRAIEVAVSTGSDLEEMSEIIVELSGVEQSRLLDAATKTIRMKQSDVRKKFNANRKARGERSISDATFAKLRREIGIREEWLGSHARAIYWEVPVPFLGTLTHQGHQAHPDSIGSVGESGEPGESRSGQVYDEDAGPKNPDPRKEAALRRAAEEALK